MRIQIFRRPQILAALGGTMLLGGCTPSTIIVNPDQVVVEARTARQAVALAEQRCHRYGRRAHFEAEGWSTYIFSCRERSDHEAIGEPVAGMASDPGPDPHTNMAEGAMTERAATAAVSESLRQEAAPAAPAPIARLSGPSTPPTAPQPVPVSKMGPSEISEPGKGTIWVQIAASSRPTEARAAAVDFIEKYADVIGSSSFMIEKARVKSAGTVYRTRVGPYPRFAAASDACRALKTRRLDCLVVIR